MPGEILPPDQNLSEKQLSWGYWYVTHKVQLRNVLIGVLFFSSAALLLFTIGMLVKLYLIDYPAFKRMEQQAPQNLVESSAVLATLPQQLTPGQVQIFDGEQGRVDAVVEITNPNPYSWATWTGQFLSGSTTTTRKTEYILPGETKAITDLAIESPTRMRNARYVIENLEWHRVDRHEIPEYPTFRDEHLRFSIDGVAFTSTPSADEKQTISHASFVVTNKSSYSYWTARFLVFIYRGTTIVAVNSVELQQLKTGEVRPVDVVWVQDIQNVSKVLVVPQVNILDKKVYMPQQAAPVEPTVAPF